MKVGGIPPTFPRAGFFFLCSPATRPLGPPIRHEQNSSERADGAAAKAVSVECQEKETRLRRVPENALEE